MSYLDPNMRGSVDQAKGYLNTLSRQKRNRDFTEDEFNTLASNPNVNYLGGDATGAQVNSAIDVMGWGTPHTGGGLQAAPPPPQAPAPNPQQQQTNSNVWGRINELLTQTPGYDRNAPENKMALDVQQAASQRNAARMRASEAERAAAGGTAQSGGFDSIASGIEANRGLEDASFESALAREFMNNQRTDRNQALQLGTGLLSQDLAGQRQDRYADLDASLRREGYGLQERLGNLDAQLRREGLSIQKLLGMGDIGTRLLGLMLGDRQANDRLGFDYTNLESLMDRSIWEGLRG